MGSTQHSSSTRNHSQRSHTKRKHRSVRQALLWLHSFNALLAFTALALFAIVIPLWNANFFHKTGMVKGDWPDALPMLPLFITFITSNTFICRYVINQRRKAGQGYLKSRSKPAPNLFASRIKIYLTLTILALLVAFVILAGLSGLYRFWRPAVITSAVELAKGNVVAGTTVSTLSSRGTVDANPVNLLPPSSTSGTNTKITSETCSLVNVFTRKCNPTLYMIGDLQLAAISISALVWVINLILIVFQAREHQYLKRKLSRSLRAKARAKLDLLEEDVETKEKDFIRVEHSFQVASEERHPAVQSVTRPSPLVVRPKMHYYKPEISRSRSFRDGSRSSQESFTKPAKPMRQWLADRVAK